MRTAPLHAARAGAGVWGLCQVMMMMMEVVCVVPVSGDHDHDEGGGGVCVGPLS